MPKAVRAAVRSGPYAADQALSADRRFDGRQKNPAKFGAKEERL